MRAPILAGLLAAASCTPWTDVIRSAQDCEQEHFADDKGTLCLSAIFVGATEEEAALLRRAVPAACTALRDPAVAAYIEKNLSDVKAEDLATITERGNPNAYLADTLDPAKDLSTGVTRAPRRVDVYIVVSDEGTPGLSAICVGGAPSTRAIRINRRLRLTAATPLPSLVNTLAHELVHLHRQSDDAPCLDRFTDSGGDVLQCKSLSYVIGNAAACSTKRGAETWGDREWRACMRSEADVTPGYQSAGPRSAFGCD